jgi:DNA mismatch repair protein MSH4
VVVSSRQSTQAFGEVGTSLLLLQYINFFSIHDHLLTRLSNDDDMEKNLSTFANEMASCAMILGLASSRSLVLIDELGRATSPKEGVGISHAIAEELIKLKVWFLYDVIYITDILQCFTFFAT